MKELTKTEEEVMQILWKLDKAFVKDVIAEMPDSPPYNTISSVVRILEKKGFVAYKAYGKTHEYYPIISKVAYRKFVFEKLFSNYFSNSYESLVSFFVKEKKLSPDQIKELTKLIEDREKEGL